MDLEDFEGNTAFAEYNMFGVMSVNDKYKLILGLVIIKKTTLSASAPLYDKFNIFLFDASETQGPGLSF